MVRLDPDQLSVLIVCVVNAQVALSLPRLEQEPEVREFCSVRTRDILQRSVRSKVRDEEEEEEEDEGNDGDGNSVGGDDDIDGRHFERSTEYHCGGGGGVVDKDQVPHMQES